MAAGVYRGCPRAVPTKGAPGPRLVHGTRDKAVKTRQDDRLDWPGMPVGFYAVFRLDQTAHLGQGPSWLIDVSPAHPRADHAAANLQQTERAGQAATVAAQTGKICLPGPRRVG